MWKKAMDSLFFFLFFFKEVASFYIDLIFPFSNKKNCFLMKYEIIWKLTKIKAQSEMHTL